MVTIVLNLYNLYMFTIIKKLLMDTMIIKPNNHSVQYKRIQLKHQNLLRITHLCIPMKKPLHIQTTLQFTHQFIQLQRQLQLQPPLQPQVQPRLQPQVQLKLRHSKQLMLRCQTIHQFIHQISQCQKLFRMRQLILVELIYQQLKQ